MTGFISVHIGAGYHSEKNRINYNNLCKKACLKGVEILRSGGDCMEAACLATCILEDSELTNAGRGSNLTWDGNVECDAAVMDSLGRFGAVAAVPEIQNPIRLAQRICQARSKPLSLERVPPCLLAGNGALNWAKNHEISTVNPSHLISEKAKRRHCKYKKQAQEAIAKNEEVDFPMKRMDTVGAVCVDLDGRLSAVASSGGVLLKAPGRVGQVAQYAAGVWAQHNNKCRDSVDGLSDKGGIAVVSTGTGEQLIATLLAKTVAEPLITSPCPAIDLHNALKTQFINSPMLMNEKKKLCGVLVVKTDSEGDKGELLWGHTTLTMALGYMSTSMKKPKSILSKLVENKVGIEPIIGGITW